jgi:hypothetical protein
MLRYNNKNKNKITSQYNEMVRYSNIKIKKD